MLLCIYEVDVIIFCSQSEFIPGFMLSKNIS